jgi:hypothetical protein
MHQSMVATRTGNFLFETIL